MPDQQQSLAEICCDIHEICARNKARLGFLTIFGASLYGTESTSSDLDIRGVFIPGSPHAEGHSIHISSNTGDARNNPGDVDIDLYSLQRWLHDLRQGSISALDMLYAPTNSTCTLYHDPCLDPVFGEPLRYYNLNTDAPVRYAIRQAKKYGCKGSRAGALYAVYRWLEDAGYHEHDLLEGHIRDITAHCGMPSLCHTMQQGDDSFLALCGKLHQGDIAMREFAKRIRREAGPYLPQIEDALRGRGLDYKALSHAIRGFLQTEELLVTGGLVFPLSYAGDIQEIKSGRMNWPQIESELDRLALRIQTLQAQSPHARKFVPEMGEAFLQSLYGGKS